MELIKTKPIGNNTLSIVDLAGSNGGKWRIARVIRVIETQGSFQGANRTNVVREHFSSKYDGRSKKQKAESLTAATKAFDAVKQN